MPRKSHPVRAFAILAITACSSIAYAYILPADAILSSVAKRRSKIALKTIVVEGTQEVGTDAPHPVWEVLVPGKARRVEHKLADKTIVSTTVGARQWTQVLGQADGDGCQQHRNGVVGDRLGQHRGDHVDHQQRHEGRQIGDQRGDAVDDGFDGAGVLQADADDQHREDQHQDGAVERAPGLVGVDAAEKQDGGDGEHREGGNVHHPEGSEAHHRGQRQQGQGCAVPAEGTADWLRDGDELGLLLERGKGLRRALEQQLVGGAQADAAEVGAGWVDPAAMYDGELVVDRVSARSATEAFLDPEPKLAELRANELDAAVLSVAPPTFYCDLPADAAARYCAAVNIGLARFQRQSPDRFRWFAHVPMQDTPRACDMLREAHANGAIGVEIPTLINGRRPDEAPFEDFWRTADALGLLVMLHPFYNPPVPGLEDWYLQNAAGNPQETMIAGMRLICSGLLDRYRNLSVLLVHGGGNLPYQLGRLRHAISVRPELDGVAPDPWAYCGRLLFDTLTHDDQATAYLVGRVGAGWLCTLVSLPSPG